METTINTENRNVLARKVLSGQIPVEQVENGLARAEVKIFYRKLDRASRTLYSRKSQLTSDIPVFNNTIKPANSYTFPKESSGPFKIYTKFQSLVA